MTSRRAFVVQTMALAAFPASAAKSPPPKTAYIRWPGPGGDLHGYMAIPAKAHGPQPAVLVVHDADGADTFTRSLCDQLAVAGLVACAPNRLASLEEGVASVRWLATNAYATGRVGAIGLGWGGALVDRLAASPQSLLAAEVTFGETETVAAATTPSLRLQPIAQLTGAAYDQAWAQAIAFLRAKLS